MKLSGLFKIAIFNFLVILGFHVNCKGQDFQEKSSKKTGPVSTASENSGKPINLATFSNGFNAQMMRGPAWQTPGFIEQVKALHPRIIRYPGGTVASYWDWKTGLLKKDIPIRKEWKSITNENPIKLEDLKYACEQTGAIPLFVLNMMTSTLAYQLEMLHYAKRIGLPVSFVELDNEFYLGDDFYVNKYPTGVEYGIESNIWITAIKQQFPNVKVGVIGNSVREGAARKNKPNAQRGQTWNRDVLSVIENADGMTFHVYGGSGLNFIHNIFGMDSDSESDDKAQLLQSNFDEDASIAYVLSIPFLRWNNTSTYDYKIVPDGMKPWITEYNLFEREGVVAGTWAHGLYALMQTLLFMNTQQTEMICYHNLTTTAQFAAIFNSDSGFFKAVKRKPTPQFGFTAAGYCLSLYGQAMADGVSAAKLDFTNNIMINAARGNRYPALNGWKIMTEKSSKILVANLSANAITVNFSKLIAGNALYTQLSTDPHQQVATEKDLTKKTGTGTMINLPAYSVTLISGE